MLEDQIREQKRRECENKCLKCQKEYLGNHFFDSSIALLLNRCSTCVNGLQLKQLDSPEIRGRVGNWQPW